MEPKLEPGEHGRKARTPLPSSTAVRRGLEAGGAVEKRHVLLLTCLILGGWLVVVLSLWPLHRIILNLDEVDYYNASRLGVWANATDQGSLSPVEFFQFINSKRGGGEPVYPAQYDEQKDPLLLRHYHPPFVVYVVAVTTPLLNSESDRAVRVGQLLGALCFLCVLFYAYRSLSRAQSMAGMLAVLLFGIGMSYLAFYSLSFHGWLAVWTTLTALFLSRWLKDGDKRAGVLMCATTALTIASLETGLVIAAAVFLSLLVWKPTGVRRIFSLPFLRYVIAGALITALFVFLFWPGSLIKISFFKTPLVILYRSLLGQEFQRTLAPFITLLPISLPVFAACAWLFYAHRDRARSFGPFMMIGVVYAVVIIVVTPFGLVPQYLVPALAPLACLVGLAVDSLVSIRPAKLVAAAILVVVAASVGLTARLSNLHTLTDTEIRQDIVWLKEVLRGRDSFVNGSQIYQHYLGAGYRIVPIDLSYDEDEIFVREKGKYRLVTQEEVSGRMVVIPAYRTAFFRQESASVRELLGKCRRLDRATMRVYDCSSVAPPVEQAGKTD